MPIPVISKFKPINNGQFPVVEDIDVQGGFSTVDTLVDRDNIPSENRKEGMLVFVIFEDTYYTLTGGINNSNWSLTSFAAIIPDGGTISGSYSQDVFCRGSATIVGNVTIAGDLISNGNLINNDGYNVTVRGDLKASNLFFTPLSSSQVQGNLSVGGNLIVNSEIYFQQTAGSSSTFEVGGDLTAQFFYGDGYQDANGLSATIRGNFTCYSSASFSGGAASSLTAGNGGSLVVHGNLTCPSFDSNGGEDAIGGSGGYGGDVFIYGNMLSQYYSAVGGNSPGGGGSAGNGGSLEVRGDLVCNPYYSTPIKDTNPNFLLSGGEGTDSNGGNSGALSVNGNASIYIAHLKGGNSTFTSGSGYAGEGGVVSIRGKYSGETLDCGGGNGVQASGGNAFTQNSFFSGTFIPDWNKGFFGDVTLSDFLAIGGNCTSNDETNFAGCGGGNPNGLINNDIKFYGNLTAYNLISVAGGNRFGTLTANGPYRGGYAGKILVNGNCSAVSIRAFGGNSSTTGGAAGTEYAVPGKVTVRGNLTCGSILLNGGLSTSPNTPGGEGGIAFIFGSVKAGNISTYGGDSTNGGDGGNGGAVQIDGNATVGSIYTYGGDCNDSLSLSGTYVAGNGGTIDIGGSLNSSVILTDGGDATEALGGGAGNVSILGDAVISTLDCVGGYCNSTFNNHNSGIGGSVTILGNLSGTVVDLSGGDRDGTLSASASLSAPSAGSLSAASITLNIFNAIGGTVNTANFSPCNAGNGGALTSTGFCRILFINNSGGNSSRSDGGNSGGITAGLIAAEEITSNGGNSTNGAGGSSLDIICKSDINSLTGIYLNSGNAGGGNSQNCGNLSAEGDVSVNGLIEIIAGNCTSLSSVHFAGRGGNIACNNLNANAVYCLGGFRSGATTVGANNLSPNGGNITVRNNLYVDGTLSTNGGTVSTTYSNAAGGNAGSVIVYNGTCRATDEINLNGGSSNGRAGGSGGNLYVFGGQITCPYVGVAGGNANASTDLAASTNGRGGQLSVNGCQIIELIMSDGSGAGAAPTGSTGIGLNGSCSFGTITMPNRAASTIRPSTDNIGVELQIQYMVGKTTLNTVVGTATSSVSALLGNRLFIYDHVTGGWRSITSAAVP